MMTGPKERWDRAMQSLSIALEADVKMREAPNKADRDAGTVAFCDALDKLIVDLGYLRETGALEDIGSTLDMIYGRAG